MYKQIATDGSELANRTLAHGLKLANEVKARVTIVTVTPQKPPIASWSDVSPALQNRRRTWRTTHALQKADR